VQWENPADGEWQFIHGISATLEMEMEKTEVGPGKKLSEILPQKQARHGG
jgi:hypothetical protein